MKALLLAKEPKVLEAYWAEVTHAWTGNFRLDRAIDDLQVDLSEPETLVSRARSVVEQLALVLQASLLVRFAPDTVADAFCSSRLSGIGPGVFGKLPSGVDTAFILERHAPENSSSALPK